MKARAWSGAVLAVAWVLNGGLPAEGRTVSVGMYPSYPPLDMRDPATNALMGFDVDLSAALAGEMGVERRIVETSFAQLIPSLLTDRIQMFFNGMMDTPARRQSIGFVDYLRSGLQFVTATDDGVAPRALPDLCGRMVATSRITSEPAALLAWSERNCTRNHRPEVRLFAAENSADARLQLMEGRVVAVLQDSLTTPWTIRTTNGRFRTLGEPFAFTPLGIGLPKGDRTSTCAVQAALLAVQADGTYLALIRKWHLPESSAMPASSLPDECSRHGD